MVEPVRLVLSGFGAVGRAFAGAVLEQDSLLHIAAVRGHGAEAFLAPGSAVPARSLWVPIGPIEETLSRAAATVLVQALPSSPEAHARALEEAAAALRSGVDVVTATKSHILSHWRHLEHAAVEGGSRIRISGATGAALPTADMARVALRGMGCNAVRACPNGTSTFVLDELSRGAGLESAVLEAQVRGIAEADPSADLSGKDAATKVRLIAGLLWNWDVSTIAVGTEPIDSSTAARALEASGQGLRLRAVASASLERPMIVTVRLEAVAPGDPLFAIAGPEKAMVFRCPDAGDITVQGGRSSPKGAALAMLKDVLNLSGSNTSGFR
ncbi:homoserine dehydrogenase [Pseudarthrobacter sp. LMD1-1-1.1]